MNLESLVSSARREQPSWDPARADRVLSSTLALRSHRALRARVVRRSIVAMSSVGVVVLLLLRGAGARTSAGSAQSDVEPSIEQDVVAARDASGDGGYRRD